MANDSSTGGPLQPLGTASPQPLEGAAWLDFLQAWIVGMTGLAGTNVTPRWQAEPINIPAAGTAWIAFGVTRRSADTYPYVAHISTGDGHDEMHRHETFTLAISCYDTGSTGQADYYASLLRDGCAVPQNQEYLQAQNCNVIAYGDLLPLPVVVNTRWLNRIDFDIVMRREIRRDYAVLNVLEGAGTIKTDQKGLAQDDYDTHFITPFTPSPP
jgi:hypothetical protein